MNNVYRMTLYLNQEEMEALDKLSKDLKQAKSAIIREAILYLKNYKYSH